MAQLTEEQKKTVAQWTAEGASLNEVQDRLKREFDITLTYLDARLLILELGLKIQEKKQPEEPKPEPPPAQAPQQAAGPGDEEYPEELTEAEAELLQDEALPADGGASTLTVSLDAITVPGTMVSGKVTFSDGKTGGWYVDQFGRLGLQPPEPGYQPPPTDIPAFQRELDRLLRQRGY
ncbi:hypothetical protein DES53_102558 [Roseimicrobium gellanilyticum]|uniref:Uncharacterized protein n=1 Tax=Roseimicrobium gellanilyticum TaxID=748857 RepID=A0A366HR93_9BACT|nr:hypothetical protein [Roseimicrobium gellanilyticum]RBP46172.1 hypothetical protein DES53_102558 [Roseimicrobium gellanilyticum]